MSRLTLILPGLAAPFTGTDCSALPRLPALESWLARARRQPLRVHWHSWLAMAAAGVSMDGLSSGGMAAVAMGATDQRHYWLATPVHYVAGLDSLRLHPAGLLHLSDDQQRQLVDDFAKVFAGSGWELLRTGRRDLLLAGRPQPPLPIRDPSAMLGRDPAGGWPRSATAAPLRRLASELELWLHTQSVNVQRQAASELPVNGLWLWGGGALPGAAGQHAVGMLRSDELYSAGLWQWLGGTAQPVPDSLTSLPATREPLTVVLALGGDGPTDLQRMEGRWLAPALQQLRQGQRSSLCLIAGDCEWTLSRFGSWRIWRRPRPWWEALRAC